jgi:hypothetical protein
MPLKDRKRLTKQQVSEIRRQATLRSLEQKREKPKKVAPDPILSRLGLSRENIALMLNPEEYTEV